MKKDTVSLQAQETSKKNQITNNTKEVGALTEQNRVAQTQIQPIVDAANVFKTKLTGITEARTLTDSEVHEILALQPKSVVISGISYTASAQTVTGSSGTAADILSYAQVLRDTGTFTTVVSSIVYNPIIADSGAITPNYNFTLNMK